MIDDGKTVLFAFEEAIGFMLGQNVLDKDGVSAAAVMAEIINYLDEQNITLAQQLGKLQNTKNLNFGWVLCMESRKIKMRIIKI